MSVSIDKRGRPVTKRNKYGVAPKEDRTVDGITFASKREAMRYLELKLLLKCGEIIDLELQPKFTFPMGFAYVADFRYLEYHGKAKPKWVIEDVKGCETAVFKLKRKCMAYFYPDIELKITK